ncbi:MAG: radical SAM protein [Desulfobacterales bacterium]|nr:radical SAM protein [Desulfobacterales bacterium]
MERLLHKANFFYSELVNVILNPRPTLSLHLTDQCNSECRFCAVDTPVQSVHISTESIVNKVLVHRGSEYKVLVIHGGEPTVSSALFPVLSAAHEVGIRDIHLQTNGIRLADFDFVKQLIAHGVTAFMISLHGPNNFIHEKLTRTSNSFRRVLKGIENCLSLKALVRTNTLLCRYNRDFLYETLALSASLGVPWQNISALHLSRQVRSRFHDLMIHPQKLRQLLPKAVKRLKQAFPATFINIEGFPFCHAPGLGKYHLDRIPRKIRMIYHDEIYPNYDDYMNQTRKRLIPNCVGCARAPQCNGIYHTLAEKSPPPLVWPEFGNKEIA